MMSPARTAQRVVVVRVRKAELRHDGVAHELLGAPPQRRQLARDHLIEGLHHLAEPAAEERKLVTVVFADLAASTELANHLDAERFREVMQAFYQMVSRELS